VLECMKSGGSMVVSPRQASLAQARVSEVLPSFGASYHTGDELQF